MDQQFIAACLLTALSATWQLHITSGRQQDKTTMRTCWHRYVQAHMSGRESATCRLANAAVCQGAGRKVVQYQTCCHGGHADAIVSPYSAFPVLCSIGIQAPPDCSQTQPYTRVCQQKDRVLPSGQRFNTYTSRKQTRGIRGESQSTAPTRPPSCPLVLAPT